MLIYLYFEQINKNESIGFSAHLQKSSLNLSKGLIL